MITYRSGEASAMIKAMIMGGFSQGKTENEIVSNIVAFKNNNLGVDQHSVNEAICNFLHYCHDLTRFKALLKELDTNFKDINSPQIRCQYASILANHDKDFINAKMVLNEVEAEQSDYAKGKSFKAIKINILLLEGFLENEAEIDRLMQEMGIA